MKLIDADELKKEISKRISQKIKWTMVPDVYSFRADEIFDMIEKAPTVKLNLTPGGAWLRKEDVIHSIAKQYSEHNELIPIWLSIGDMKGGAEDV